MVENISQSHGIVQLLVKIIQLQTSFIKSPFCEATDTPSGDVCPGFQSQGGFPHRFAEEALNLLMIGFAEEAVTRGSDESRRRVLDGRSAQPISDREDVSRAVVLVVRCSRESTSNCKDPFTPRESGTKTEIFLWCLLFFLWSLSLVLWCFSLSHLFSLNVNRR